MNCNSLNDYADYLQAYLENTYNEFINYEYSRDSNESDWYRAERLLDVCNIIERCNSFFIENVNDENDLDKYLDYVRSIYDECNKKSDENTDCLNSLEIMVLSTIISPLLSILK